MRRLLLAFLAGAASLACAPWFGGLAHAQTLKPAPPVQGKTVAQTLALMGLASRFAAAAKAARLDSVLNLPKVQYTVFVPSNEAFRRLEENSLGLASATGQGLDAHQMDLLLRFHVVPGRYPTEALKAGQTLRTLNPAFPIKITAQGTRLLVSGTNTKPVELVNAYIVCNNGIIHLIEDVMVPFTRQPASK